MSNPEAESVEAIDAMLEQGEALLARQNRAWMAFYEQANKVSAQMTDTRKMLKGLKERRARAVRMQKRAAKP